MHLDLHPLRIGLTLSLLSIFLGFALGGFFGMGEDAMKKRMKASAEAVRETVYRGDEESLRKTLEKSWIYLQRAHLHLGAIGTAALAQCLLLAFLDVRPWLKKAASFMLGAGAAGYGIFWLIAGFRAPGLGGTSAAKEGLRWLGQPSAALCLMGASLVLYGLLKSVWRKR